MSRITFAADVIDAYLLGGDPPKARVVEALLADRSSDPKAAPFYRAFTAVGAHAADEALIALRLVLAGLENDDQAVMQLRGLAKTARAGGPQGQEARAAYAAMLTPSPDGDSS
jgi:hypothetical protein